MFFEKFRLRLEKKDFNLLAKRISNSEETDHIKKDSFYHFFSLADLNEKDEIKRKETINYNDFDVFEKKGRNIYDIHKADEKYEKFINKQAKLKYF